MRLPRAAGWILGFTLGAALAGCSGLPSIQIETKKVDYKSAGRLPPLEVPPDLTRPSGDERFAVPDINPRGTATYSEYSRERSGQQRSSVSAVLPSVENVRVERDGNQRWLVVKGSPEQIWPVVKEFWQENGFIVNLEIPEAGVMETDWAENRAKIPEGGIRGVLGKLLDQVYSTSERDKFRTRLERGAEPGTTEIYVSHRGMEEVYTSTSVDNKDTRWQPRPPDPNLEAEMLWRMMVRFGVEETRAKSQLAAAGRATPRASLHKGANGASVLALSEQFDRAWRRVGLALDRVGFTVEDRDRSKGIYFVRYMDPQLDAKQPEKGWFARLKFWGGGEKPRPEQYRIEVKGGEQGSEVKVLNKDGGQESSETANRILTLLYDQLK
ncbi:MAG TPA: outer membrane protein assembly factor BamC [Burkholderiales bacterium]|nr:outer membrane protein assembly factor BamC [Burkholderiales bacterium]